MLNQKKVEIFLAKFRKSLAKQFLEIARNILLVWDLRDTTQRRADESLWTMDSTYKEVICCSGLQITYHNTYTFSDEDFAAQQ